MDVISKQIFQMPAIAVLHFPKSFTNTSAQVCICVRTLVHYGRSQIFLFLFSAFISYTFCASERLSMLQENRSQSMPTILRFLRRTVIPLGIVCNSSKEAGGTRVVMVPT